MIHVDDSIGSRGAAALAATVPSLVHIESLVLARCLLRDRGVCHIAHAITAAQHPRLTNLNLSGNSCNEDGAHAIAEFLCSPSGQLLQQLSLTDNRICDVGGVAIGHSIQAASSLTKLSLGRTYVSDGTAAAVARALSRCVCLTDVDLSFNAIQDEGATPLIDTFLQRAASGAPLSSLRLLSRNKLRTTKKRAYEAGVR